MSNAQNRFAWLYRILHRLFYLLLALHLKGAKNAQTKEATQYKYDMLYIINHTITTLYLNLLLKTILTNIKPISQNLSACKFT